MQTFDLPVLQLQSRGVTVDFDLHLGLRNLDDKHQAPPVDGN